jgi:hypothetical protein
MWFRNERGAVRLLAEGQAMRHHFPSFRLMRLKGGLLAWRGRLRLKGGSSFLVSAELPSHYPNEAPVLRVLTPSLVGGCPHRYRDGSLCVYLSTWHPGTGTVVQSIANAADWLAHYQGWRLTGVWRS